MLLQPEGQGGEAEQQREGFTSLSPGNPDQPAPRKMEKYVLVPQGLSPYSCDDLNDSQDEWFIPFLMPLTPNDAAGKQLIRTGEDFEMDQVKMFFVLVTIF